MNKIRKMTAADKNDVLDMMRVFYASPAILSNGSEEIFEADFCACVSGSPYAEGYVFTDGSKTIGYAMLAKSYSTEFGKPCVWIEDLYVLPGYRRQGTGGAFLEYVKSTYSDCVIRLEAESSNADALAVYKKHGFDILPYTELKL